MKQSPADHIDVRRLQVVSHVKWTKLACTRAREIVSCQSSAKCVSRLLVTGDVFLARACFACSIMSMRNVKAYDLIFYPSKANNTVLILHNHTYV